jgi:hypothetical protein
MCKNILYYRCIAINLNRITIIMLIKSDMEIFMSQLISNMQAPHQIWPQVPILCQTKDSDFNIKVN